ncbi:MAG TPA: TRAP transporter small permease [Burkholderiales bacterium]|nr:TRAP transporter small permease [Burkholderiales bacterium]
MKLAAAEAWFVAANRWALILLLAAMALLVFANVISRYLLNFSWIWIEELTRYMMVWVGFLGSGLVLRLGAHIAVDVLQEALPRRAAQALRALIVLALGATFAAMTWLGVRYAHFAWEQETPAMNWSTGAIYLAIPIGSALMLVHLLLIARSYVLAREFVKDDSF